MSRDDDFDPVDDEEEADLPDPDETQEGEDTEILEETEGFVKIYKYRIH